MISLGCGNFISSDFYDIYITKDLRIFIFYEDWDECTYDPIFETIVKNI